MKLAVLSVVMILFGSCSKKNSEKVFDLKQNHLIFGNGGGFTGASSSVFLTENGDVYRSGTSDTSYVKVGKIDLAKAKQQFSNYQTLGLDKLQLNEPGNRYYFITRMVDGKEHKIQWGKTELKEKGPAIMHKIMMDLVKKIDEGKK